MVSGGHARSGPAKVPGSRTSERAGFEVVKLPAEGYAGVVPDLLRFLPTAGEVEQGMWADLWASPQAHAWSTRRWLWPVVADLVMWRVRSMADEAAASVANNVRQLRDDLGLSEAARSRLGWEIAAPVQDATSTPVPDEVGERRVRRLRGGHPDAQ